MINLSRNKRTGEKVEAKGKRVRSSSIYTPNQEEDFQISRSKFQDFLSCPRTFWFDRVKGLKRPDTPQWTLNSRTDSLLKKEFDDCREKQVPHPLMIASGLENIVPYNHANMTTKVAKDNWRDALHGGLKVRYKNTNIILSGGIDDMWINTIDKSLLIVEYKSQSSDKPLTAEDYLSSPYKENYMVQMDYYAFLMKEMKMNVNPTGYFVVVNAIDKDKFDGHLTFDQTLVPYEPQTDWIPEKIDEMIELMDTDEMPLESPYSENAAYENEVIDLIHNDNIERLEYESYSDNCLITDLINDLDETKEKFSNLEKRLQRLSPKLVNNQANENPDIKPKEEDQFEDFFGGENVK